MNHRISRAWNDITQHHPALRNIKAENTALSPQDHGNWLERRSDAYWSNFCRKGKPSMRLVTFRRSVSLVVHCVTNVQGRKRSSCNTTVQGPKLLACAWTGFRRTADNFSPIHPTVRN